MLQRGNLSATNIILWRRCVWSKRFASVETGDHNTAPRTEQGYREIPPTGYRVTELCSVYPLGTKNNFHKGKCCLKDTTDDLLKGGKGIHPRTKTIQEVIRRTLTETVQSMSSQTSRPSWGKGMDANKFKAITLLLAMDNSCTPEQVLNMTIDSNEVACHKTVYKSIN